MDNQEKSLTDLFLKLGEDHYKSEQIKIRNEERALHHKKLKKENEVKNAKKLEEEFILRNQAIINNYEFHIQKILNDDKGLSVKLEQLERVNANITKELSETLFSDHISSKQLYEFLNHTVLELSRIIGDLNRGIIFQSLDDDSLNDSLGVKESKKVKVYDYNKPVLSQQQFVCFLSLLKSHKLVISDISKVNLAEAGHLLSGYSKETIRQSLSKEFELKEQLSEEDRSELKAILINLSKAI